MTSLPFTIRDLLDRIIPLAKQHGLPPEQVAAALRMPEEELHRLWDDAAPEPQPIQWEDPDDR